MYPDQFRRYEAYCKKRCPWTARTATYEGAHVLAEYHERVTTRLVNVGGPAGGPGQPVGHQTSIRDVQP